MPKKISQDTIKSVKVKKKSSNSKKTAKSTSTMKQKKVASKVSVATKVTGVSKLKNTRHGDDFNFFNKLERFDLTKNIIFVKNSIKENFGKYLLTVFLDFLFFFLISLSVVAFVSLIYFHAYELLTMIGDQSGGLMTALQDPSQSFTLASFSTNAEFMNHLNAMFMYMGINLLGVFIAWIVTQSTNFWISKKFFPKKENFRLFIKNFLKHSLIFGALSFGLLIGALSLFVNVGLAVNPLVSQQFILFLFGVLMFICGYFLVYALSSKKYLSIKESFVLPLKNFRIVFPLIGFIFVFYYLFGLVWDYFAAQSIVLSVTLGFLIFLPSLSFFRLLFMKFLQNSK